MKHLLNTLYVTIPEAYLSKDGMNVVVSVNSEERFRVPVANLESICTFGYQGASPGLMKLCSDNGVALTFFSPNGRYVARMQGPVHGNVLLRARQYRVLDDETLKLHLSSLMIYGKIYNSRVTLRRFVRDYPDRSGAEDVSDVADRLGRRCQTALTAANIEELRGIEGDSANLYFGVLNHLILNNDDRFHFPGRCKRPPTDIVNAMLSFGYSMLTNDCASALEGVGLDPAAGFMHSLRPGRFSLALDLMEELRSYIVDRLVISMINNRQMTASDFLLLADDKDVEGIPVRFTDDGLKKFLSAWQNRKKTEIIHPFLKEKVKLGLLPHVQAMMLARYLRGDLDDYPVFLVK